MTQCCQCEGLVTPPPPPDTGACCYYNPIERVCQDNVSSNDCLSRPAGVHFPNQTCASVACGVGDPTTTTTTTLDPCTCFAAQCGCDGGPAIICAAGTFFDCDSCGCV